MSWQFDLFSFILDLFLSSSGPPARGRTPKASDTSDPGADAERPWDQVRLELAAGDADLDDTQETNEPQEVSASLPAAPTPTTETQPSRTFTRGPSTRGPSTRGPSTRGPSTRVPRA